MTAKLYPLTAKRTRQPVGQARIDWSNPITRGLKHCLLPSSGLRDMVSGELWQVAAGNPARRPGIHGMSIDTTAGFASLKIEPAITAATAEQTHLFLGSKESQSENGAGVLALGSQSDQNSFSLISLSGYFTIKTADGESASSLSSADPVAAQPFLLTGDAGGSDLYYGGVNYASSAYAPNVYANSRIVVLSDRYADGTFAIGGKAYLYAFWPRRLRAQEIASISRSPWQLFAPDTVPFFTPVVTAQYASPSSDVSSGTWTASSGSDLYAMLDESVPDDGDYIVTTGASTCEVALGSLSDPAASTGHVVRYRISSTGGGITVRLRQGTTTIASWTHSPAPTSLTTYEQTLSGAEADSITSYAALKLQFEATP